MNKTEKINQIVETLNEKGFGEMPMQRLLVSFGYNVNNISELTDDQLDEVENKVKQLTPYNFPRYGHYSPAMQIGDASIPDLMMPHHSPEMHKRGRTGKEQRVSEILNEKRFSLIMIPVLLRSWGYSAKAISELTDVQLDEVTNKVRQLATFSYLGS